MTRVKICGLTTPKDIAAVNAARPEYVGFVFWRQSKRYVSRECAFALKSRLSPAIAAVGVFVDETVETVAQLLNDNIIDIAQLHGHEDERYIAALRARTDKPIWQAFIVRGENDVMRANASSADLILLDAGYGCGETFDYALLKRCTRPYILAGGLTPKTVSSALRLAPYAVDVSSGVETDGVKDTKKIQEFIQTVRRIDNDR